MRRTITPGARWVGPVSAWALSCALGGFGCGGAQRTPPAGDALDEIEAVQLFHLGNALAERGDSIRAEQYLSAAMEQGYPASEVVPRLMEVCIAASRLSAALGYAEPYLAHHDDDWALRLLVATLQMTLNQVVPARGNLERVVRDRPDEAMPHYLLGVLFRDRYADGETANLHFTRYLELAPDGEHGSEARASIAGNYVPAGAGGVPAGASGTADGSGGSGTTESVPEPREAAPPDAADAPRPVRMPAHDTALLDREEGATDGSAPESPKG